MQIYNTLTRKKEEIVKRKGKLYVICKKNPKFKMRQG